MADPPYLSDHFQGLKTDRLSGSKRVLKEDTDGQIGPYSVSKYTFENKKFFLFGGIIT